MLIKFVSCLLIAASLSSCSLTPTVTEPTSASYDGNDATSGVVAFLPDGSLEISERGREHYNALIGRYGSRMTVPIKQDFGVKPLDTGDYSLTLEGADYWHRMSMMLDRERIDNAR